MIQYGPFVEQYKQTFINNYCTQFKITDEKIVKKWYTDINSDKGNWPILLDTIETQMSLTENLFIKLKPEIKKSLYHMQMM